MAIKDSHTEQLKVRLTENDKQLLYAIADHLGIRPAVLARSLIKKALNRSAGISVPTQLEMRSR